MHRARKKRLCMPRGKQLGFCSADPATFLGYNTTRQLQERHWFHPWCISAVDDQPNPNFKTLGTVRRNLGHDSARLMLMKLDIEGFEHELFASWRKAYSAWLPELMAMEVHCTTAPTPGRYRMVSAGEATALLRHFHLLGYRLSSLESEGGGVDATFVRVVC